MSLEFLLLLALFVLLPLIQQLFQAARQRDTRTPERAERPPLRKPQAPTHAPPPPTLAISPRPGMAPRRSTRRRPAVVGLRNRLDLRRAIVLMAILGPCRAINPYDWPERAARE